MFRKLSRIIMLVALAAAISLPLAGIAAAAGPDADIAAHKSCKYCGMDRERFSKSRMLIEYNDGSVAATCSIHCAAVDLANNIDKMPNSIKVSDYDSGKLIDAEKANWVIISGKMGVMTRNAKWAFGDKTAADEFMKKQGGKAASFDEAMKASYEDMYSDTKMIREKRMMMKMKKHEGHGMSH